MTTSPRARRRLIIAAVCFGVFSIVGFFVLPPVIKAQAEKRLSAELGRTVTIGKVRVNPYVLSLTIENFDVRLKDGTGSFLGWTKLYVNFDALSSLMGDWVLSDVKLDGAHVGVEILPDGTFNFADLLAKVAARPPGPAKPGKPMRPVRVGNLVVTSARLEFTDRSKTQPFTTVLGPVNFSLTDFRTVGADGAPYHFAAVTEAGEKLAWTGTLSAEPLRSVGELTLENLVLSKYSPYYADFTQADLVEGKMSVRGRYEIDLTAGQRAMKLLEGGLQLRGVKLVERATKEVALELPTFDLTGVAVDALKQKASIAGIQFTGGRVHVRRDPDGSINLLTMLKPAAPVATTAAPTTTVPAAAAAPAKLPEFLIGEISFRDFQINVADHAAPRPAQLELSGLQFSAKQVTLAEGAVIPLDLAFTWSPQGTVHVAGTATLKPQVTADLKADVTTLEILPLSPYLEQFVNARITQGSVSTSSTVHVALADGPPSISVAGDASVDKFGLVDSAHNDELAGFSALKLFGIAAATAPQLSVSLQEVTLSAPYARVLINADKSINLLGVAKTAPAASPSPATETPAAPAAPLPKIAVGRVVIADGDFTYADRSLEPNVRMAISQFGGTVAGLSSENLARADVDLKGLVDGAGPVAITGKLDPLGASKFVDLKVDFKNVDLLPISPYTGKYAGYELARGKLVVDTKVHVEGTALDVTNVVTLNQFTFGAATNSPDATGLPVRLGVALLKDLDGKIVIDLPVQGTLGDPNFRIGKVVMRVVVNLLTKAATSPFALLGSMFGGGGDELAFQEFGAGSSELLPAELPKLDTMVKALTNRPGLSLGIEGSFDPAADTFELKRQKLADQISRRIWEARHAINPNIPPPKDLVITPDEHAAEVRKYFLEKFPPGTELGAAPSEAPVVMAAPAVVERPGFIRRVIYVIVHFKRWAPPVAKVAAKPATAAVAPGTAAVTAEPSLEEMFGRLAETVDVTDNDLRELATDRAQRVRDYLFRVGRISADRLFLAQGLEAGKAAKGPRVFLTLQ